MTGVPAAAALAGCLLMACEPLAATFAGAQTDTLSLTAEWLVPGAAPGDVLATTRATMEAAGFKIARDDRRQGVLVTRSRDYLGTWPSSADLKLPPSQRPTAAAIHVFASPEFTPARVAIAVVLDVEERFAPLVRSKNRATLKYYSNPALSAHFASEIAARGSLAFTPLAAMAEARAAQVAGVATRRPSGCGAAPLLPPESTGKPTLISQVKPIYPRLDLMRLATGVVLVRAELTEHGTLTDVVLDAPGENANLAAAAIGAASLWRFRAPVVDGCPARRRITIEMSFSIGR